VPDGPYIYMFNHTSILDTFVVMAILPEFTSAIGKKEQFRIPIWGTILRRWGTLPIDRHALTAAIENLDRVGESFARGRSVLIAPEGTRSHDGRLGPFKKGPFHIASRYQARLVPIAIVGAFRAKHKGSWILRPGVIQARIGLPLESHSLLASSVESLRDESRRQFEALLSGQAPNGD